MSAQSDFPCLLNLPSGDCGGHRCQKASWCAAAHVPNRGCLSSFVWLLYSGSVTRGDSDRSIWDTGAPCRIKQAMSQAPVTGNLTQITKGRTDCIWQVHPLPLDAMSLFCLDYLCVSACIFGAVCMCTGSGIFPHSVYLSKQKVTFLKHKCVFFYPTEAERGPTVCFGWV